MIVTPFETYQHYLSLKNHFTNPKYDFFKYGAKTRASVTSFNKRKDKYWFEKEQSSELFSENELEKLFDCSKGHPILLKEYLSGRLSLENFVIYDKIFHFSKNFDKKLTDPVWETVSLKLKKYGPFINIDVFNYKKLLRSIVNE